MIQHERYVVVPDLHGHAELLASTHKIYGDIGYVILGDVVDGPEVKQTLDIIKDIDAALLIGNHEWAMMAAMYEIDPEARQHWASDVWLRYRTANQTIQSYGRNRSGRVSNRLATLSRRLWETGHLDLLRRSRTYYEDEHVVAIHGGATNSPWVLQRHQLDEAQKEFDKDNFGAEPIQIFDHTHVLSKRNTTPISIGKILITGHTNLVLNSAQRVTDNGRRVRLGSRLHDGSPLYVWENWSGMVKQIEAS